MPKSRIKLSIEAKLANIGMLGNVARMIAHETGLSVMTGTEVELAVVEAVTNIVKYGLTDKPDAEIEVVFTCYSDFLQIDVCDQGLAIPTEALAQADGKVFDYAIEDMNTWPTSSMGLSLIKAVMDSVEYQTLENRNTLRLVKFIENQVVI
ncbi:ATP-binding protein [Agitococcus lubricus]|uniref:Anti-sigma regulatory factor (Ser/Thr protein kinase) n=1 Tax=Agitococcus lubricus TaxID=1077255 RepID=A0A2T5IYY9_9GAMM|nr:ATP-binding protein [Agitococcus lubricus]PTQ89225.1 anti-sigma regulatory factor (Ser/Thr protein kinase) [Agitococcus lubricus]